MALESNKKNKNKSVMIIGGGTSGMAAAEVLSGHGIDVHLIEKSNHLGGHASAWACMATQTCQHCASCLSFETAEKITQTEHLNTYFNTQILKIEKNKDTYSALLTGDHEQTIEAQKIIIATGFMPTQPQGLLGEAYACNKQIITTKDLNQSLRNNTLFKYLSGTSSPKIGFIQCVGSRNRERGRDYCSQVCCKITLRHINKLIYLYPDAKISLFYIDLQVIGKEIRSKFEALSDHVELIQGVPFEIFTEKNETLSVIREDEETGNRMADFFDMMVLSVGIQSPDSTSGLTDMLDIPLDQWGFINDHDRLGKENIYVAGCATGPVDILTAKHQGIQVAERIIQSYRPKHEQIKQIKDPVAIIGDGQDAQKTARAMLDKGYDAWMFGTGNHSTIKIPHVYHVPDSHLISINGAVGAFTILYKNCNTIKQKTFSAIVVAEPVKITPAGKKLTLSDKVLYSLNRFLTIVKNTPDIIPQTLVFWLDYSQPESKLSSRAVLLAAMELAKKERQITIITSKMLVHRLEGQQLYDKARKLGIRFLRVGASDDVSVKKENGRILFNLKEETLKNMIMSFESDWLIIPEKIQPGNTYPMIAALLKDGLDTEGYLQSANVRHRLTHSPRKGIFYAGSCHDEADDHDWKMEIELILSSLEVIMDKKKIDGKTDIEINASKCSQCLTCFRACPHGAVILDGSMRPYIVPEACFSCGLCLSSCPALAIESKKYSDTSTTNQISGNQMVVFACERSGALAVKKIKQDPFVTILKVPCVCRISENILLKTLESGAIKIILAGCHEDNCRSMKGSHAAQMHTKRLTRLPGIDDSCISFYPVAANEGAKFEAILAQESLAN